MYMRQFSRKCEKSSKIIKIVNFTDFENCFTNKFKINSTPITIGSKLFAEKLFTNGISNGVSHSEASGFP